MNQFETPEESKSDYAHRFAKSILGIIPYGGTALGELFTVVIPPSIEKRRNRWMREVSDILNDLIETKPQIIADLKDDEEFISLLLNISQKALKTHREEKINLFTNSLRNSFSVNQDYFIKEKLINYIDEIDPNQVSILNFLSNYVSQITDVDSYQKFYNLLTQGSGDSLKPSIDSSIDSSVVRFYFKDLEKMGLIFISESIIELENYVRSPIYMTTEDSGNDLPFIKTTLLGELFLNLIEEKIV